MWIIGCGLFVPHQIIWIGTKHSLVTKTTGTDGFLVAPAQAYSPSFQLFPCSKVEKTNIVLLACLGVAYLAAAPQGA